MIHGNQGYGHTARSYCGKMVRLWPVATGQAKKELVVVFCLLPVGHEGRHMASVVWEDYGEQE